jgi:flagellar basal-body rod protein FlgB
LAGFGSSRASFRTESKGNYEVRPTGNAVNIEEEMMKVAANQMDYQAATAVYSRSLGLIKTALGKK